MNASKIEKLQRMVNESGRIVFFGGAGVSTESGIPDFRSEDGLYNQRYAYPPEVMVSRSFYDANKQQFFAFYRDKMLHPAAQPNEAHKKLAQLEQAGKLEAVITQNIDGLHQKAGCQNVLELHGSVLRNYCQSCGKLYGVERVLNAEGVPLCECGGEIKPDVVLYEPGHRRDAAGGTGHTRGGYADYWRHLFGGIPGGWAGELFCRFPFGCYQP